MLRSLSASDQDQLVRILRSLLVLYDTKDL
jgi:hypothetical protein